MHQSENFLSEEDVRSKLLTEWLVGHGFSLNDFSVEFGFEIQFGRQTYRPRSDIVVRNTEGKNLFIIEVKAPYEKVDERAKRQAISYARLLQKGGIAPFTIITNGKETHIYDSISEELIDGATIPPSHPYVLSGYRISCDDLHLRSEALETLICLSADNLIEFCRSQVSYRMKMLKSNKLDDGKKYIPDLYIDRPDPKDKLETLLETEDQSVIILEGPPQVGKTNFVCHTVEEMLEQGYPCLFYPAIAMQKGLLEEICADFQWLLGDSSTSYQLIHNKLDRILQRTNRKITIFIDGWNEADVRTARLIDLESERLAQYNIRIVVSMTNLAASRLLLDEVGNPSRLAEAAFIDATSVPRLEIQHDHTSIKWNVVSISKYSKDELEQAYKRYSDLYNVVVPPEHHMTDDPFLLRIAMNQFKHQVLPVVLDEPELIAQSIIAKGQRAVGIPKSSIPLLLTTFADTIFQKDAPLLESEIIQKWKISTLDTVPSRLLEAALLIRTHNTIYQPMLDFYYGRERDFVLSTWAREWTDQLSDMAIDELVNELTQTIKTNAGTDALRWFLAQPKQVTILKQLLNTNVLLETPSIHRLLLSSLSSQIAKRQYDINDWIRETTRRGIEDESILVKIEAAKLLVLQTKDDREIEPILINRTGDLENDLVISLLTIEEEFPLSPNSVSSIVLEALYSLHFKLGGNSGDHTEVSALMEELLDHQLPILRTAAAKAYGHIACNAYLESIHNRIVQSKLGIVGYQPSQEHATGITEAIGQLEEIYYGSYCPGWLESLRKEPEQLAAEYNKMCQICQPIIRTYATYECSQQLLNILVSLEPDQDELIQHSQRAIELIADQLALKYQLRLPFDEIEVLYNIRLATNLVT